MVSHCINPTCNAEFKKLTTGDLYAFETRSSNTEFFWLCSACVPLVNLFLDLTGGVAVRDKLTTRLQQKQNADSQLRRVYSHSSDRSWLRTGISRELTFKTGFESSSREAL